MRVTEMFCSDRETTAASVLSQMSKIQQSPLEAIETQSNMSVAHQCDVETTASASSSQEILSVSVGSIADNEEHENELDERMNTESANSTLGLASDNHQTKLQTTLEVSSAKVFPCEYCGKIFNKSYNLKTHHRVHTGERPFPCVICGHRFANLGDLKRHNRTHTGEKPFTCEFCDKAFSDFGSHKRHLRLHTGFKPFKCEQCDRQFTRLDSFKNHTRLHTGERPYKCEECQKQFNYLTTYKRHLNIHSGERPYTCDLCHKTFTRLTYLRNHKLNHGKLTAKSQSDKKANEQETSSAGMDTSEHPSMIMKITSDSNESKEKTDDDDHVIHHVAQVLSEGGVHVSVTTVVDGSGNSQPVLIKTPGTDSQEATSHALIFTQDLLNASSANDNSQLLTFTSDDNNEEAEVTKNDDSSEGKSETRQLFLAQPLFKSDQDFTSECQLISPSFDGVMSVTQRAGDIVSELNEETTQVTNKSEPTEGTAIEVSSEDPDVSNSSNISCNAVYIAIDPTQTSVQQILGELHVAVNPESLTKET